MKKLSILILAFLVTVAGFAQSSRGIDVPMKNYQYATKASDTVTNTGVGAVQTLRLGGDFRSTGFQIVCTKISGTVAGTITLMGSLDGTNFKAIPTEATQTSMTTATALDVASQTFVWWFKESPFLYYRVSWTGTGTMAATISGRILAH